MVELKNWLNIVISFVGQYLDVKRMLLLQTLKFEDNANVNRKESIFKLILNLSNSEVKY